MIDSEAGLESSRRKKEHCYIESIFTRGTILALVFNAVSTRKFDQFVVCLTETDSGISSACGK